MRGRVLHLLLVPALLGLGAQRAPADEMLTVSGERIPGIVLEEGPQGVWFEAAPRVAVYFEYDDVVRAVKWDAERNATLFDRSKVVAPPKHLAEAEVVLETPEGAWVRIKPRFAQFVEKDVLERAVTTELDPATADSPSPRRAPRRDLPKLDVLRELYEQPEPLTPAQLTHRAGRPDKVTHEGDEPLWIYDLGNAGTAFVYFFEGKLDYVDIAGSASAKAPEPAPAD